VAKWTELKNKNIFAASARCPHETGNFTSRLALPRFGGLERVKGIESFAV
jgi:nitrite reductase/ring-hydroxylating ferredoxin subunit